MVSSQKRAQPPSQLQGFTAKSGRQFFLADVIPYESDECEQIRHRDGFRRGLFALLIIGISSFLLAALALVLNKGLKTAEPPRGLLAERLLAEDAMGAASRYRKRPIRVG